MVNHFETRMASCLSFLLSVAPLSTSVVAVLALPLASGLTSCSVPPPKDEREAVTVKAAGVKVSGDLEGFLEVVPGDYFLTPTQELMQAYQTRLRLRVIRPLPADVAEKRTIGTLSMELSDSKGSPVPGVAALEIDKILSSEDVDRLMAALRKGEGEVTVTFALPDEYGNDKEVVAEALAAAKSFTIGSVLKDRETPKSDGDDLSESAPSTDEASATRTTSDADWDRMLADYEAYTSAYIRAMKKAGQGDMSAVTEYTDIMSKATTLAEDMERLEGEATPAQLARFVKAQARFTEAALGAASEMKLPR